MSFTSNPYRHMDVVTDGDAVSLRCDSCSADLHNPGLSVVSTIAEARRLMDEHITRSHRRTPAEFAGRD